MGNLTAKAFSRAVTLEVALQVEQDFLTTERIRSVSVLLSHKRIHFLYSVVLLIFLFFLITQVIHPLPDNAEMCNPYSAEVITVQSLVVCPFRFFFTNTPVISTSIYLSFFSRYKSHTIQCFLKIYSENCATITTI